MHLVASRQYDFEVLNAYLDQIDKLRVLAFGKDVAVNKFGITNNKKRLVLRLLNTIYLWLIFGNFQALVFVR